jgi:hypothetical protein
VTDEAEQLIMRALAKDPGDRPASAEEFIQALDGCHGQSIYSRSLAQRSALREDEEGAEPRLGWRTLADDVEAVLAAQQKAPTLILVRPGPVPPAAGIAVEPAPSPRWSFRRLLAWLRQRVLR